MKTFVLILDTTERLTDDEILDITKRRLEESSFIIHADVKRISDCCYAIIEEGLCSNCNRLQDK